jgi:HlyD family secretion protein
VLAQKTFDRTNTLTEQGNAPQARLDQVTDTLHESERAVDQAKSAYDQAVNGYTKEERDIARTNVEKANADIQAVQSLIDQLVVYAPSPRRSTSAMWSRANMYRRACRSLP